MNMTLGIRTDYNHSESFDPKSKGEVKAKTSKGFHHERVQFCFSDELDLPHHVSDKTPADKNQIERNVAHKDKSYVDDDGICDLSNQNLLQLSPRLLPLLATVQMLYLQVLSINMRIMNLNLPQITIRISEISNFHRTIRLLSFRWTSSPTLLLSDILT